ncbi:MAG: restriction endonuclease subunit S [Bacteroidaceae bacterium]|nr:restriction endonuclease subunit S [Bacteroidaceae bacterium]
MVEWKKLGEVCEVLDSLRKPVAKDKRNKGDYPYYGANGIQDYVDDYIFDGTFLLFGEDGSVINADKSPVLHWATGKIWVNNHAHILKESPKARLRYLYYCLQSTDVSDIVRGVPPKINQANMRDIPIPLPSLSEQERIVGILDTFTSSIENLKAQISLRRKQYEHYRDKLLDLEGKPGVEMKTLGEVCEVINGRAYSQPELLSEGKYRVLRVGNFFSNDSWYYSNLELEDKYYCNKGDLLYAWSASFGPHIWEEEKTIYHYHIWKMNCSNKIYMKYMYYWLQSEDMKGKAFGRLHGATMAHLTKALMESLQVPLPSLEEQSRIVSILDEFEASIKNLEAQLEAREKQYEYYRNKLLTFE